ncbi:MAG: SDR family oxidoreductase [Oscillospiraceae bacterium]|nr:SDR family oxidoreductase [Oscillospiraceae bacterium]
MKPEFTDKIAVITGGARGIGRHVAEDFVRVGTRVAVVDKDEITVPCEIRFRGDIVDKTTLTGFVDEIAQKFGSVDYLINNACLNRGGILSDCGYDDFMYVQKVGVVAPYMLTKLLLPYFNENASIVNISSTRAYMSQPDTEKMICR